MEEIPWFKELGAQADRETLSALRATLLPRLDDAIWEPRRQAALAVRDMKASFLDVNRSDVTFGSEADLTAEQKLRLEASLKSMIPWKKGPFSLMGVPIDAEWRSDVKWDRFAGAVGSLKNQCVADIGCHNGYFMYRMLAHEARTVIGFEPHAGLAWTFAMLQGFYHRPELHFELFGVEHTHLFQASFDTIFCMGILYHHTDPVGLLRKMRTALKSQGRVFIDCQGIAGDLPLSLTPQTRYAGASGIWFLPTLTALRHWATRAGFSRVETLYSEPLDTSEQRSTAWAPIKSLAAFLDPADPEKTIEGYPAPWRHYLLLRP